MSLSNDHDKSDISKNILNRITYLINKRLSNFNLNKIDNIYENTKSIMLEMEKQNLKLNNKVSVLENLLILQNNEINDLKKKFKNQTKILQDIQQNSSKIDIKKDIVEENNEKNLFHTEITNKKVNDTNLIQKSSSNNLIIDETIPLNKVNSFNINNYIELKKEVINLDLKFVKKCLESHNINSDLNVFKKMYIDDIPNSYYSIRHIKGNYQYWLDGKMNIDDENGTYIKDVIINNISNVYLNANSFDNYKEDTDLFIKNQEYIVNMGKQKYKDKLFKNILKIIEI